MARDSNKKERVIFVDTKTKNQIQKIEVARYQVGFGCEGKVSPMTKLNGYLPKVIDIHLYIHLVILLSAI